VLQTVMLYDNLEQRYL